MDGFSFFGDGIPGIDPSKLSGKLIVLEGADSVGRSTQVTMLSEWLESLGHAVAASGLSRSELCRDGLELAKSGHTLGRKTMSLFYATDFADRLENQIIPALRAGYHVISDRYLYSICARDIVRGANMDWLKGVYGFSLKPDIVIYLRVSTDDLIPRALFGKGFNYWESGMDMALGENLYDSFKVYLSKVISELDKMADDYKFFSVDASRDPLEIFEDIKSVIKPMLTNCVE